ncbi:zinc finger protein ZAT11-like [Vigna umbellata]|uniref:zinc finger protein ZAT11-like n=1 Tax=Vigna umbellata TaxID=87088 RepID=UPI001F5ECB6F|nr:zinc finger protein ZAT11-like [Vigna umbellata]
MNMKRQREIEGFATIDLANCLMLLSCPQQNKLQRKHVEDVEFECKTCKRKFSSFQALGGHRASHKRSKLEGDELKAQPIGLSLGIRKPKMHECTICGQEFSLGQALGGHMRRHRASINGDFSSVKHAAEVPVLKRSNSTRGMCMDLNLTPLENDFKLLFGKTPLNAGALV